jgi:hypothetical protein
MSDDQYSIKNNISAKKKDSVTLKCIVTEIIFFVIHKTEHKATFLDKQKRETPVGSSGHFI